MYATAYCCKLWNKGDTRVFDAPEFLGVLNRIRHERRRGIYFPPVYAVHRARGAEMRETAAILYAAKEERGAVRKQGCSGIEHAIDPVRPVFAGQNWIAGMPMEKRVGGVDRLDGQSHR